MSRKYYRRRRSYEPSPLEMLFEMVFKLSFFLIQLFFKLLYKLFILARDRFYRTSVEKRVSPDIKLEVEAIPEVHFDEKEEEKEVYLPYKKKSFLLTKTEYNFDRILTEIVADKYYIGRQVPLSSIVEVTSSYKPYRSKIDKKTIDFVLFNKAGYTPHLAIELDDPSHLRWDRIERDEFVHDVLKKADIRLIRIKSAYVYDKVGLSFLVK